MLSLGCDGKRVRACRRSGASLAMLLAFTVAHAQLTITGSATSSAGGIAQGGTYSTIAVVGQGTPAGLATGGSLVVSAGFIPGFAASMLSVQHTVVATSLEGQAITVHAMITPAIAVTATLHYRKGGDPSFTAAAMPLSGSDAAATIPQASVTALGVEYIITVTSPFGGSLRIPSVGYYSVQVTVTKITDPVALPPLKYRLVSLPLIPDDARPSTILPGQFGGYDNTVWRFYELRADQKYYEYPGTAGMDSGRAFWLIVKGGGMLSTLSGKSNLTNQKYAVPLSPGWTFVGNPFGYSIPLSNITLKSGSLPDIRKYSDAWSTDSVSIDPFSGYAVANGGSSSDTLSINPDLTAGGLPRRSAAKGGDRPLWQIRIQAESRGVHDDENVLAVSPSAAAGLDPLDRPKPPVIGDYVSVSFPHPEWNSVFSKYCTDVRPLPASGDVWDFEVGTNIHDVVTLIFAGVESVPGKFEVWLLDRGAGSAQNLCTVNRYLYQPLDAGTIRAFSVVVGSHAFAATALNARSPVPVSFALDQNYPNPFNPTTAIRYALPHDARVTLKVFDVLGQEVVTLVDEVQSSGFKTVEFSGRGLASGVYLYRIVARAVDGSAQFTQTHRMLLIK